MGRHSGELEQQVAPVSVRPIQPVSRPVQPVSRPKKVKQAASVVVAFFASVSFLLVNIVDPYSGATASSVGEQLSPEFDESGVRYGGAASQSITVEGDYSFAATRETYLAEKKPEPLPVIPEPSAAWAPPAVTPDPGSAQAYAAGAVAARGWPSGEFDCLVSLWNKESGWRVNAHNSSSGAYGIPQSLPGSKMASAGADWETNAATQIEWGLGYIQNRYGTPCGAWASSVDRGWY